MLELSHLSFDISVGGDQPRARAAAGGLTVRLTAPCAVPTTGEGQTVVPGVKRFQLASTSEVVDVFPGGCVTYRQASGIGQSAPPLDLARLSDPC